MIQRKRQRTARVGVFAVAHAVYWEQFPGLLEKITGYHGDFLKLAGENGVEVIDFGMIDSSEKSFEAARKIAAENIDLLICNMVTYATSSVFAPIIRNVNVPVILAALQPLSRLDYTKASTFMQLENDNICSVPEFTGVAVRMEKKVYDVIIGTLYNDSEAAAAVSEWCEIAKVLHDLKGARIGLMGHVLEAMYDMHADPTAVSEAFGIHVPLLEIDDVVAVYNTVTEDEIEAKIKVIDEEFDMPEPESDPVTEKLTAEDKYNAAKTAAALDKFTEKYNLTGLAYYYEGLEGSIQRKVASSFIVGNSILNAQGFPMCGEFDIKTCIAMLIMDRLGIGGSFAEFHPFDFAEDFILVGHDGFIFDFYWFKEFGAYRIEALNGGFMKAENNELCEFSVMWCNHDPIYVHPTNYRNQNTELTSGGIDPQLMYEVTEYCIKNYFPKNNYIKVDGKAYFGLWNIAKFIDDMGGTDGAALILNDFRRRAFEAGFEIHLAVCDRMIPGFDDGNFGLCCEVIEKLGIDSVFQYSWQWDLIEGNPDGLTVDYGKAAEPNINRSREIAERLSVPYDFTVSLGWDTNPRTVQSDAYDISRGYPYGPIIVGNTPDEIEKAFEYAEKYIAGGKSSANMMTVATWNDWTEGNFMEPDNLYGYGYLEAFKKVFG